MRIYVASSWRNEAKQQATVEALRRAGHTVYDFRNPAPGNAGFSWRQCSTPEQLKDPLLDDPMSEPEPMYLMCSDICVTIEEVVEKLAPKAPWKPSPTTENDYIPD